MQIATENQKLSNTVKWVVDNSTNFTNEVAIARETANTTYKIGDVVGIVSGKVKRAVETATDGSKVFYGVVLEDKVIPADTDVKVLVMNHGPASVNKAGIFLDSTYDNATKRNVVYAAMEAAYIQLLEV
jgi:hypothetical protein